jgi:protease I
MAAENRLKGKRIAILVETLYEDLELWYPLLRLREEGAETMILGPGTAKSYNSKHDYPAVEDATVDVAEVKRFDAVVIPGGYSPDHMRRHPAMVEFVRQMHQAGKIVAAICHAGWMLASADIIKGKNVTCYYSIKDDVINAGGKYRDEEVVVDGNIITSRKPDDLPAFCRAIIKALAG